MAIEEGRRARARSHGVPIRQDGKAKPLVDTHAAQAELADDVGRGLARLVHVAHLGGARLELSPAQRPALLGLGGPHGSATNRPA